jgi:uncharacterized alkaline shock family protein YloU
MGEDNKEQVVKKVEAVIKPDPAKAGDSIRISSEVIAVIVGLVSQEVPGIAGKSGGLVGGIAEKLGRRDLTKGIKVQINDDSVIIDLNVISEYGVSIIDTTAKLKQEIRTNVEKTTGLKVEAVNINVQGINVPKTEEELAAEEKEEVKE